MRAIPLRPADAAPVATAATLALVAVGLGWRGADWPAQLLRLELVERDGPGMWSNLWFAGHHTPGYGILFPLLGAVFGAATVAVASCIVAAAAFHVLAHGVPVAIANRRRTTAASVLFAAGTVVNVAVGRLTFALGLAIGLAALAALQHRKHGLATALVALTAPASPVAAVMLGLALAAWALHTRARRMVALTVLAVVPVGLAAVVFPQGGRFPFGFDALVWSLVVAAVVALWTSARVVRYGAALYAVACVATFLVQNPLGANATRLGMFVAAPILVVTARRIHPLFAIVLPALVWWQWSPGLDGIARAGLDPSSTATYHQPLIAAVQAAGGALGRIEVVPTQRHWETVYVAAELPLARGWERQLDIGRNEIFYEGELGADAYHRWLRDHGVRYVAVADVATDPSALQEAALVRSGLPFLEPVWHDDHWRLWRVVDAIPLVDGPGRLVELGPTAIVLDVMEVEPLLVRVRFTSHWSLDGPGCVAPSPDGWTVVHPEQVGPLTLRPVLARSLPIVGPLDACRS